MLWETPFLRPRPSLTRRAVSLPRALSKLSLCSRTQAFRVIAAGHVSVNGRVSKDPSLRVSIEDDRIEVGGVAAPIARKSLVIALHKPTGYVTTRSDPQGRPTVYDLLPPLDRFVFPVGRLDKDTSGLLILTDDHRLGETLTNPKSHVPKTYEVIVNAEPDARGLAALRSGLDIGKGEVTRPSRVEMLSVTSDGPTLIIVIDEGKNRQIRRMVSRVGLKVRALKRVRIGDLFLGELPVGKSVLLDASRVERLQTST